MGKGALANAEVRNAVKDIRRPVKDRNAPSESSGPASPTVAPTSAGGCPDRIAGRRPAGSVGAASGRVLPTALATPGSLRLSCPCPNSLADIPSMSMPAWIRTYAWLPVLLGGCGFWLWLTVAGIHRVEFVSNLVETDAVIDPASPTGYAGGLRHLIVPERNDDSCQWIVQTQQMLARHEWRVRHVDYDNAPLGRDILTPSPYRWWLGAVAGVDHLLFRRPIGLSVESAALVSDPVLHLLLLIGTVIFAARRFGNLPATVLAAAMVTLFPFGGGFLPGQPDDQGLAQILALWSVLLLLGGAAPGLSANAGRRTRHCFLAAGVAGGIGLWVGAGTEVPILGGIVLGGIAAAWTARRAVQADDPTGSQPLPWRIWALAGAGTSLVAFLLEYAPAHLSGLHLETVHPLYGLAWLGAGEWLMRLNLRPPGQPLFGSRRAVATMALAALPVAAVLVVALLPAQRALYFADSDSLRLTNLPGSPVASSLWIWARHDGLSLSFAATCLPLLLLIPAGWLLASRTTAVTRRTAICLSLGPVMVALAVSCVYMRRWNTFDTGLLTLMVTVIPASALEAGPGFRRWAWVGSAVVGLLPGLVLLVGNGRADWRDSVNQADVEALIDRDLAFWLANASGAPGTVVLAPPGTTVALYFHGGLSGIGTLDPHNRAGMLGAIRIAAASSPDEARALAEGRKVGYVVLPSWDNSLDAFARIASNQFDHTFIAFLHRWLPPRWLRPVPYHLPNVAGFEGQSVAIFAVVDVQDNATALSHLAEYFVEMGQIDQAVGVAYTLEQSFPADLGAAVARALTAQAAGETAAFEAALHDVEGLVSRGDDKTLPWDRRVSLAAALFEGKRYDLSREQVRRCLAGMNEAQLRSLTTASLYRLLAMGRAFGLGIVDPRLRDLARNLLPTEMRGRI